MKVWPFSSWAPDLVHVPALSSTSQDINCSIFVTFADEFVGQCCSCFRNWIIINKTNITLYIWRFETSNKDHELFKKVFAEVINQQQFGHVPSFPTTIGAPCWLLGAGGGCRLEMFLNLLIVFNFSKYSHLSPRGTGNISCMFWKVQAVTPGLVQPGAK